MTHADKVTALRIDLASGVVVAEIQRTLLNDDGSVAAVLSMDGAHGESPIFDDPALLTAAQTFANKIASHVETRFGSQSCEVVDGKAVAQKRRDDAVREAAEAAEVVPA